MPNRQGQKNSRDETQTTQIFLNKGIGGLGAILSIEMASCSPHADVVFHWQNIENIANDQYISDCKLWFPCDH